MNAPNEPQSVDRSSAVLNWLLGREMPLMARFALFILFTAVSVVATFALLPHLVVLGPLGYLAGFLINLFSSASIVVPGPGLAGIMLMATKLNPFLLGVVTGIGGTIGELTGYWLGMQGRDHFSGSRMYSFLTRAMARAGGGLLFFFGLLPFLPIDVAGVMAGASNYSVFKFLLYVGLGKVLMSVIILYLAAKAYEWAQPYLTLLG